MLHQGISNNLQSVWWNSILIRNWIVIYIMQFSPDTEYFGLHYVQCISIMVKELYRLACGARNASQSWYKRLQIHLHYVIIMQSSLVIIELCISYVLIIVFITFHIFVSFKFQQFIELKWVSTIMCRGKAFVNCLIIICPSLHLLTYLKWVFLGTTYLLITMS